MATDTKAYTSKYKDESLGVSEVKTLLSRGADINYQDEDGDTALSYALLYDQDELALALIESGADLSLKNNDGETAIEYAIYSGSDINVIQSMLKNGASLDFTIEGLSPLEYAKEYEIVALEQVILQYLLGPGSA